MVGRFDAAEGEIIPYSDKRPDRCTPARGPEFLLPGDDAPRRCGVDSAMPPATDMPHWKRRVRRGFEERKR